MAPTEVNYWTVICPDKDHNAGLWRTWLAEDCVALGWSPSQGWKWNGPPTDKPDFELARKRASRMSEGDIIIPYLCNWRFGIPARVERLALADSDFDPTGYRTDDPSEPGLGRRIHVRWLKHGAPPLDKVAVMPRNLQNGRRRYRASQAVEPLKPERYAGIIEIIRNRENWKVYDPADAPHKNSGGGAGRSNEHSNIYPDEPPPGHIYFEGAFATVLVNRYERDPGARRACLAYHGTNCAVCGLSFDRRYGDRGKGFIHVHHLKPLGTIRKGYRVNPKTDLAPVCPNCHAMLHREPLISIKELRVTLR
jgi:5-methylcytosine-specific restriction protein A